MKSVLLFALAIVFLLACHHNQDSGSDGIDESNFKKTHPLDSTTAKDQIVKLKKIKFDNDSIAYTEFDRAELRSLLRDTSIKSVRFYITALDTKDVPDHPQNTIIVPAIILQLKKTTSTSTSISYYSSSVFCPPPGGGCKIY